MQALRHSASRHRITRGNTTECGRASKPASVGCYSRRLALRRARSVRPCPRAHRHGAAGLALLLDEAHTTGVGWTHAAKIRVTFDRERGAVTGDHYEEFGHRRVYAERLHAASSVPNAGRRGYGSTRPERTLARYANCAGSCPPHACSVSYPPLLLAKGGAPGPESDRLVCWSRTGDAPSVTRPPRSV